MKKTQSETNKSTHPRNNKRYLHRSLNTEGDKDKSEYIKLGPGSETHSQFTIYDSSTRKKIGVQESRMDVKDKGSYKRIHTLANYDLFYASSILRELVKKEGINENTRFIKTGFSVYNINTFENTWKNVPEWRLNILPKTETDHFDSPPNSHLELYPKNNQIDTQDSMPYSLYSENLNNEQNSKFFKKNFFISKLKDMSINMKRKRNISTSRSSRTHSFSSLAALSNRGSATNLKSMNKLMVLKSAIKIFFNFMGEVCNILFPFIQMFSISTLIIIIQWTLFYLRLFLDKGDGNSPVFVSFSGQRLKEKLAIHTLVTSIFLHSSIGHLLISTIMHFRFSFVMENTHGSLMTLTLYLLCSVYGMVSTCWFDKEIKQANGFAGDWGLAGLLLSNYLMNIYSVNNGSHHLTNFIASAICLSFVKASMHGDQISIPTHVMSALGGYTRINVGFCSGYLLNIKKKRKNRALFQIILVCDIISISILSVLPIASIVTLFVN